MFRYSFNAWSLKDGSGIGSEKGFWSLFLRLTVAPGGTDSWSAVRFQINFWRMVGLYISFGRLSQFTWVLKVSVPETDHNRYCSISGSDPLTVIIFDMSTHILIGDPTIWRTPLNGVDTEAFILIRNRAWSRASKSAVVIILAKPCRQLSINIIFISPVRADEKIK